MKIHYPLFLKRVVYALLQNGATVCTSKHCIDFYIKLPRWLNLPASSLQRLQCSTQRFHANRRDVLICVASSNTKRSGNAKLHLTEDFLAVNQGRGRRETLTNLLRLLL